MTTLQIKSDDQNAINQLVEIAKKQFHLKIEIVDNVQIIKKPPKSKPKGKWAKVADEMRGVLSKDTAEYLKECSKEIRDGFELRDLSVNK